MAYPRPRELWILDSGLLWKQKPWEGSQEQMPPHTVVEMLQLGSQSFAAIRRFDFTLALQNVWAISGSIPRLLLTLHSGITPDGIGGPNGMLGVEPR